MLILLLAFFPLGREGSLGKFMKKLSSLLVILFRLSFLKKSLNIFYFF